MTTTKARGGARRTVVRSHGSRQNSERMATAPPPLRRGRLATSTVNWGQPLMVVQADCHCAYATQFLVPSSQVAMGVFQNLMVSKYEPAALAWNAAQEPGLKDSITAHALVLTGVSP